MRSNPWHSPLNHSDDSDVDSSLPSKPVLSATSSPVSSLASSQGFPVSHLLQPIKLQLPPQYNSQTASIQDEALPRCVEVDPSLFLSETSSAPVLDSFPQRPIPTLPPLSPNHSRPLKTLPPAAIVPHPALYGKSIALPGSKHACGVDSEGSFYYTFDLSDDNCRLATLKGLFKMRHVYASCVVGEGNAAACAGDVEEIAELFPWTHYRTLTEGYLKRWNLGSLLYEYLKICCILHKLVHPKKAYVFYKVVPCHLLPQLILWDRQIEVPSAPWSWVFWGLKDHPRPDVYLFISREQQMLIFYRYKFYWKNVFSLDETLKSDSALAGVSDFVATAAEVYADVVRSDVVDDIAHLKEYTTSLRSETLAASTPHNFLTQLAHKKNRLSHMK